MSQVVAPLGEASVLEALAYGDRIEFLPATTRWWRQRLYPDNDGNCATTQLNNVDNPTSMTIIWRDVYGDDDDTIEPYAVRLTYDEPLEPPWGSDTTPVLISRTTYYLDVLWYCAPTAGRWEPLTDIGNHVHPDERDHVDKLQRDTMLRMMRQR